MHLSDCGESIYLDNCFLKAVLAEGETIPYLLVCFIAYWQRLDLGLDLQKLFCLLRSSFAHA